MEKAEDGEFADQVVYNRGLDKIDLYGMGASICTSTSRPTSPWTGLTIIETDTKIVRVWTGSVANGGWARVGGAPSYGKYRRNATDVASPLSIPNSSWTILGNGGGLLEKSNGSDWRIQNSYAQVPKPGLYRYTAQVTFPQPGSGANSDANTNLGSMNRIGLGVIDYADATRFGIPIQGMAASGVTCTFRTTGIVDCQNSLLQMVIYQTSGSSLTVSNTETWMILEEL